MVLSLICPAPTKAADVRLNIIDERKLAASLADGQVIFAGELYAPLDYDTKAAVNDRAEVRGLDDWEMLTVPAAETEPLRLLSLTLRKKPLNGMVLWWRSAFKGGPEVAAEALVDRSSAKRAAAESFQSAFAQAQAAFLQKVKDRPAPVEVDLEADEGGEADAEEMDDDDEGSSNPKRLHESGDATN